jgi:hypothetical protein
MAPRLRLIDEALDDLLKEKRAKGTEKRLLAMITEAGRNGTDCGGFVIVNGLT